MNIEPVKCAFCKKNNADYRCPRCTSGYCSLNCYKDPKHADCSEGFYREWCEAEMKGTGVTSKDKTEFMERLKRLRDEDLMDENKDSDDDSDEEDLEERLAGIDLDDCDSVWAKLTDAEKAEFRNLIQSTGLEEIIPPWEPWWTKKKASKLVVDVTINSEKPQTVFPHPEIMMVPKLSELIKTEPSPLIAYSVVNLISAYVVTVRFLAGELHENALQSMELIVQLSASLFKGTNFHSIDAALDNVASKASDLKIVSSGSREDVRLLMKGPGNTSFMEAALSDVYQILKESLDPKSSRGTKKDVKFQREMASILPQTASSLTEPIGKSMVRKMMKKVEFLLSWTRENGSKCIAYEEFLCPDSVVIKPVAKT